jgi:uncharacterized protein GlcG (DUF336 family)
VFAVIEQPTDAVNKGGTHVLVAKGQDFTYLLALEGAVPIQGGMPIVMGGKVVGAIGMSGGAGPQDQQCAEAGLAALK